LEALIVLFQRTVQVDGAFVEVAPVCEASCRIMGQVVVSPRTTVVWGPVRVCVTFGCAIIMGGTVETNSKLTKMHRNCFFIYKPPSNYTIILSFNKCFYTGVFSWKTLQINYVFLQIKIRVFFLVCRASGGTCRISRRKRLTALCSKKEKKEYRRNTGLDHL